MSTSNPTPQPAAMHQQPWARWNPRRGIWETTQPDLFGRWAQWWAIWPTSGSMRDGWVYPLPSSALRIIAFASSSSSTALFRTPLASDSSRGGESLDQVRARRGTIALSHQITDLALHGPDGSGTSGGEQATLWSLIEDIFTAGDATPTPLPGGNTSLDYQPPLPRC